MSTKLVVSINGLELTNINEVVSSRSIDEVVLVSSAEGLNNFTANQRASISKVKSSLPISTSLSLALANDTTVGISNEIYDFLKSTNLSFYNDPGLQSFSNSYVLENSGVINNLIVSDNLSSFDTQTITNNSIYNGDESITLGNNFGTTPTLALSTFDTINDLNGTVKVNISASSFTNILSQNISEDDFVETDNLTVNPASISPLTKPNSGKKVFKLTKEFLTSEVYDGTNRIGNIQGVTTTRTSPGNGKSIRWDHTGGPVTISVSEALRLPLMGSAPINNEAQIILKDNSRNLSFGLKGFSEGQIASFNFIEITDNKVLKLNPQTFKNLDLYKQNASYSSAKGLSILNSNGNSSDLKITGSYTQFVSAGLISNNNFVDSLSNSIGANLVEQVSNIKFNGLINNTTDIQNIIDSVNSLSSGISIESDFNFSSAFTTEGLSVANFIKLAELDSKFEQSILLEDFSRGFVINDSSENLKTLIVNNADYIVEAKRFINGFSNNSESQEVINLTWEEYVGALSGTNFDSNNISTWGSLTSGRVFEELTNIELVVNGNANEIQLIIDNYGALLSNFPAGLTFNVNNGGELNLTSEQLDVLDARINGLVNIKASNESIANLLDNAVSTTIKSIETTDDQNLAINIDQFRNVPTYYSSNIIIKDTEDNIVSALDEDLLDDRVEYLVVTQQSTIRKDPNSDAIDNQFTVSTSAAKNILEKKIQTEEDFLLANDNFMNINIVDRASTIAEFIETATFPGSQTTENNTGLINFTEINGNAIYLNREQYRAYENIQEVSLIDNITANIVKDTIFDDILSGISNISNEVAEVQDTVNAIQNEFTTVAEFNELEFPENSNIVDYPLNLQNLLNDPLHPNIKTVGVIAGSTLPLNTNQFKNLLSAERVKNSPMYAGEIFLTGNITGDYSQVVEQINDFRITLVENFSLSNFDAVISGFVSVDEAKTLEDKGLLPSKSTYTLSDSLSIVSNQATTSQENIVLNSNKIILEDQIINSNSFGEVNAIIDRAANIASITANAEGNFSDLMTLNTSQERADQFSLKVTDSITLEKANSLNTLTSSSITATAVNDNFSNIVEINNLTPENSLDGIFINTAEINVIDTVDNAKSTILNSFTSNKVTVNDINDTYENILKIKTQTVTEDSVDGIDISNSTITVNDSISLENVNNINTFTEATITVDLFEDTLGNTEALRNIPLDLVDTTSTRLAINDVVSYEDIITSPLFLEQEYPSLELTEVADSFLNIVQLNNSLLDGTTDLILEKSTIQVLDSIDFGNLQTIRGFTNQSIIVDEIIGSSEELVEVSSFSDVIISNSDITITNPIGHADAVLIDSFNNLGGTLTLASVEDNSSNIILLNGIDTISIDASEILVTNTIGLEEAKVINPFTNQTIAVTQISDTSENIEELESLNGINITASDISIVDNINFEKIDLISKFTNGDVTPSRLTDTHSNVSKSEVIINSDISNSVIEVTDTVDFSIASEISTFTEETVLINDIEETYLNISNINDIPNTDIDSSTIKVSGSVNLSNVQSLDKFTTEEVTLSIISDIHENVQTIYDTHNSKFDFVKSEVEITENINKEQVLKTLENIQSLGLTGDSNFNKVSDNFQNILDIDTLSTQSNDQISMTNAEIQIIDNVDQDDIDLLRTKTRNDIIINQISETKFNLATINSYTAEDATSFENSITLDFTNGLLRPNLEDASSVDTKEFNIELTTQDNEQYEAKVILEFNGVQPEQLDDFITANKPLIFKDLVNGSISNNDNYRIVTVTKFDESIQDSFSAYIDRNDANKVVISSLESSNPITASDLNIKNYDFTPTYIEEIQEQDIDGTNENNSQPKIFDHTLNIDISQGLLNPDLSSASSELTKKIDITLTDEESNEYSISATIEFSGLESDPESINVAFAENKVSIFQDLISGVIESNNLYTVNSYSSDIDDSIQSQFIIDTVNTNETTLSIKSLNEDNIFEDARVEISNISLVDNAIINTLEQNADGVFEDNSTTSTFDNDLVFDFNDVTLNVPDIPSDNLLISSSEDITLPIATYLATFEFDSDDIPNILQTQLQLSVLAASTPETNLAELIKGQLNNIIKQVIESESNQSNFQLSIEDSSQIGSDQDSNDIVINISATTNSDAADKFSVSIDEESNKLTIDSTDSSDPINSGRFRILENSQGIFSEITAANFDRSTEGVFNNTVSFGVNSGLIEADLSTATQTDTKKFDLSLTTQDNTTYTFSSLVRFKDIEPDQIETVFASNKVSIIQDLVSDNFAGNDIYDIEILESFDPSVETIFVSDVIGNELVITSLDEGNPVLTGNASIFNYESIPQAPLVIREQNIDSEIIDNSQIKIFDNTLTFDISDGNSDNDLSTAYSLFTKNIEINLTDSNENLHSANAIIEFTGITEDQVDAAFNSNKVSLINELINGSITATEGINLVSSNYFDQSIQSDLSSAIDLIDTTKVIITSLNENNTIEIGDVEISNYANVPDNLITIDEQSFDSINVDSSTTSTRDVILSNSEITVIDVVNKEQADLINTYNDQGGTVTLTSVTDVLNNVNALSTTAGISIATSDLKVTDVTTLSDATTLDGYTTGEVTLDKVTDSFANVKSIHDLTPTEDGADGVDLTAATITITDPVSLTQANSANDFSDGLITLNSVIDSFDNLIAIDLIDSDQLTMANAAVQVTDEVDLSKINDLRADTTGDITVDEVKDTKDNLAAVNDFAEETVSTLSFDTDNQLLYDDIDFLLASDENITYESEISGGISITLGDKTAQAILTFNSINTFIQDKAEVTLNLINGELISTDTYTVKEGSVTYFETSTQNDFTASIDNQNSENIILTSNNPLNILNTGSLSLFAVTEDLEIINEDPTILVGDFNSKEAGDVILSNSQITVTDNVNKAEADIINDYNDASGTVILSSISDSLENVNDVQTNEGISLINSLISVSDTVSLSDVEELNSYTQDLVTLNFVKDTYDNLIEIDNIDSNLVTMADAALQVTDEVDLSKINDLRSTTTSNITLDLLADNKENLIIIDDFKTEQGVNGPINGDVILSNTDITVTNTVNKEEADVINGYNDVSGTVTLTSVTDVLNNVNTLSTTAGISIATSDLKVTDTTSLQDADTLNSFTDGEVTLDAVTDTFENVERIYGLKPTGDGEDGVDISEATINIVITDAVSLSQAERLDTFTSGLVTLNSVEDNQANIKAISGISANNPTQLTMSDAVVRITDEVNLLQIDEIREITNENITVDLVNDDTTNLATINDYTDVSLSTSDITISNDVSKLEADIVDGYNVESGIVTLTSITDSILSISEVHDNSNISIQTSSITVTDPANLQNATEIESFTDGQVTLQSVVDTHENIISIGEFDSNQVTMAEAVTKILDSVDLDQVNQVRAITKADITLDEVADIKENLATINTYVAEDISATNALTAAKEVVTAADAAEAAAAAKEETASAVKDTADAESTAADEALATAQSELEAAQLTEADAIKTEQDASAEATAAAEAATAAADAKTEADEALVTAQTELAAAQTARDAAFTKHQTALTVEGEADAEATAAAEALATAQSVLAGAQAAETAATKAQQDASATAFAAAEAATFADIAKTEAEEALATAQIDLAFAATAEDIAVVDRDSASEARATAEQLTNNLAAVDQTRETEKQAAQLLETRALEAQQTAETASTEATADAVIAGRTAATALEEATEARAVADNTGASTQQAQTNLTNANQAAIDAAASEEEIAAANLAEDALESAQNTAATAISAAGLNSASEVEAKLTNANANLISTSNAVSDAETAVNEATTSVNEVLATYGGNAVLAREAAEINAEAERLGFEQLQSNTDSLFITTLRSQVSDIRDAAQAKEATEQANIIQSQNLVNTSLTAAQAKALELAQESETADSVLANTQALIEQRTTTAAALVAAQEAVQAITAASLSATTVSNLTVTAAEEVQNAQNDLIAARAAVVAEQEALYVGIMGPYFNSDEDNGYRIDSIRRNRDGVVSSIPISNSNRDYLEYLEWEAEGNTLITNLDTRAPLTKAFHSRRRANNALDAAIDAARESITVATAINRGAEATQVLTILEAAETESLEGILQGSSRKDNDDFGNEIELTTIDTSLNALTEAAEATQAASDAIAAASDESSAINAISNAALLAVEDATTAAEEAVTALSNVNAELVSNTEALNAARAGLEIANAAKQTATDQVAAASQLISVITSSINTIDDALTRRIESANELQTAETLLENARTSATNAYIIITCPKPANPSMPRNDQISAAAGMMKKAGVAGASPIAPTSAV